MENIFHIELETIDGKSTSLEQFQGKAMLIVNVASKCGFTSQYDGLEALYQKYRENGLVVLGFPCNQFGGQEPGTETEIKEFCRLRFGVTFPLFAKVEVNGENTHPLFAYLKRQCPGFLGSEKIKWNFTKFLVDREGKVIKRFPPTTSPAKIDKEIAQLLD